jgi:hypothetical protein
MPREARENPSREQVHGGCGFAKFFSKTLETRKIEVVVTDLSQT